MNIGDHLVSGRMGYEHHGLYIGSEKVIHYAGLSAGMNKGSIEVTSLKEFAQGNSVRTKSSYFSRYTPSERVARAYSRVGEDEYNILTNNCEHFVCWCFYNLKISNQINSAAVATFIFMRHMGKLAGIKGVLTAALSAPAMLPIAIVCGVSYGAKRAFD